MNPLRPSLIRSVLLALMALVLLSGTGTIIWLADSEDALMRSNLLIQARMVAANILPSQLRMLYGSPADHGNPAYHELKGYLRRLREAYPRCRFIYLTGMKPDGTVFFFMDSEPAASQEASPPGEIYEEASPEFKRVFASGESFVEGPVADRWGDWVSALVPLVDPETQRVRAVLGMDIDSRNWTLNVISRCAPAFTLTLLLLALLIFFHILTRREAATRRKIARSEALLAESERAYRSVVMNMPDIFFRVDTRQGGVVTMLSPSAALMLGYDRVDELLGRKIDAILVHPENQAQLHAQLERQGVIRDLEFKARCRDGSELDMSVSANMIFDAFANPIGYEGIARDITERKRSEKQQREFEQLAQRAQKMETVGVLAGGVAHDLNNILCGIVSYPDLLLMQMPDDSPLRDSLTVIKESGIKAATIVQDLLTLARRGVSVAEIVDLNAVVRAYLQSPEFAKLQAFHPRLTIRADLDEALLPVMGSPVHLSKTLMNLVTNAAESMPGGGGITIATCNRYLDHAIRGYDHVQEGDYVILSISDDGIGIADEDRDRIFEPFYSTKKMGRSGSGLGMAVVWGTVKDHQGYIDLQSAPCRGTVFSLYFPVTRAAPAVGTADIGLEDLIGRGEKIVVIDDVREQREIASAMLAQLGYAVETLPSGEEAVAYLREHRADLLVLDMIMAPGMDGLDTLIEIMALSPGQRAIISSGYSETDRVKQALHLGAKRYLRKPYTLMALGTAVREALKSSMAATTSP